MSRNNLTQISANEFFGFKRYPFIDQPNDPAPLFSVQEERMIAMALHMLHAGKSFVLTGAPGTGKTTLVRHLREELDTRDYLPLFVPYSGLNRAGFLKTLAAACHLDLGKRTVPPLLRIQKHLLNIATDKNPRFPVLIIDDAQLLEQDSLLDLCSLLADPDQKRASASLVLVGDETLQHRLSLNVLTPVWNRMACAMNTEPLGEVEAMAFIHQHIERAQAPKDLFQADAISMLAAKTRGNRREMINTAVVLLTEAMMRNEKTVGAQLVLSSEFWKKNG
ncbi:MAG: AAA family ATPase [Candidatus Ozemobacteraceae bacterium]